jgi:hypothetical protein
MQAVASLSDVARCCVDPNALEWGHRLFLAVWERVMRKPALGLRRIYLRSTRVNKYNHARLSFLVNEEHALVKPVRRGLDTGLGVQMLRPKLSEVLVCVGKLARRERFTSAGCHYNTRSSSLSWTEPIRPSAQPRRIRSTHFGEYALKLTFSRLLNDEPGSDK